MHSTHFSEYANNIYSSSKDRLECRENKDLISKKILLYLRKVKTAFAQIYVVNKKKFYLKNERMKFLSNVAVSLHFPRLFECIVALRR